MGFAYEIEGCFSNIEGRVPKTTLLPLSSFFLDSRRDRRASRILAREISDGSGRRGGRRWEGRRRRETGRRQAMDEMLTRRETIDYSRRGGRGCSRA